MTLPSKTAKTSTALYSVREEEEDNSNCHYHKRMDRRGYMRRSSFIFRSGVHATVSLLLLPELASTVTAAQMEVATDVGGKEEQYGINASQQQQRMVFGQRPRAPTASLLPATQQRLLLKKCLALSEKLLVDTDTAPAAALNEREEGSTTTTNAFQQLKCILVDPRVRGDLNYYTPNLTFKQRNARDLKLLSQYQKSNRHQLSGDVVQAAMNLYTDNLKYSKDYTVQDQEWKKSYIRSNDGLPDVERVVRADMDLRVLYRNQVQLKVDDAAAELYSIEENSMKECAFELQQLLRAAVVEFDLWFDMIDDTDVKEAVLVSSTLEVNP